MQQNNHFWRTLLLASTFMLQSLTWASDGTNQKKVQYTDQTQDQVILENVKQETRYRTETFQGTCIKKEPYTAYQCWDVTKYETKCYTEPSYQDCDTVYDRRCTTRYRDERRCSPGPSRQQCSTSAARQECSRGPSRRVCKDRPTRRVCKTTPTRQVCKNNPRTGKRFCTTVGGKQTCSNVGGGQSCSTVPGERRCRTIPGKRTCRTVAGDPVCRSVSVPYEDCDSIPRQVCRTVPSRQVCDDVPYTVEECGDKTLYKDVPYDCEKTRQVPYQVDLKTIANIDINYAGKNLTPREFVWKLNEKNETSVELTEPKLDQPITFLEVNSNVKKDGDITEIDKSIEIKFLAPKDLPFNNESKSKIRKLNKNGVLWFYLENVKNIDNTNIKIKVITKGGEVLHEMAAPLSHETIGKKLKKSKYTITVDMQKFGLEKKAFLAWLGEKVQVKIELSTNFDNVKLLGDYPGKLKLNLDTTTKVKK